MWDPRDFIAFSNMNKKFLNDTYVLLIKYSKFKNEIEDNKFIKIMNQV